MNIRHIYTLLLICLLLVSVLEVNAFGGTIAKSTNHDDFIIWLAANSSTPVLPTAPTTCNYTGVTSVTLAASGGSNAPDETNRYILTDMNGIILQVSNTPTFTGLTSDDYAAYSITYETAAGVSNLGPGNNIQTVTSTSPCLVFSAPYSFRICPNPCTIGLDSDNDGVSDICDKDDDNDGILDDIENACISTPSQITWHGPAQANVTSSNGIDISVSGDAWSPAYSDQVWSLPLEVTGVVGGTRGMIGIFPENGIELTTNTWNDGAYKFQFNPTSGMFVRHGSITQGWVAPAIIGTTFRLVVDENGTMSYWHDGNVIYTGNIPSNVNYKVVLTRGPFTINNFQVIQYQCPVDTDNDGIVNSLDDDSDGDGCFDVVESGGIDSNSDGELDGTGFDSDGLVTGGTGGYNGLSGNEMIASQIVIISAPSDATSNNGQSATFTVNARGDKATNYSGGAPLYGTLGNANAGLNYQWYNGTPGFGGTPISNGGIYSGATTSTLNISEVAGLNGTQYCVVVSHDNNPCIEEVRCAILSVTTNELCNDGQDNDGDGLIDCADPDCSPVIASVIPTQLTCPPNVNNGKIVITATGQGTLTYSINNEPNYQASNTFDNLGQGLYTIRVRSSTGCVATYDASIIRLDTPDCTEICNDGIDNDGDGNIDCDDSDCGQLQTANNITQANND